jgi:hypothetical protein
MPTTLNGKFCGKTTRVVAAQRYQPVDDLWIITCYFNPNSYQSRAQNYYQFIETLRGSGLHFLTIECAFREQPFLLPESEEVLHLRGGDVLWQKERLLNLALSRLPPQCTKVAWLDCDILFSNGKWAKETSSLLDECTVVQPFRRVVRLPRGQESYQGEGESWKSFAAVLLEDPTRHLKDNFNKHGHTGFAWAARREFLERYGLFDTCLSGSGDHAIAHALCGDTESECVRSIFFGNQVHLRQFRRWAKDIYEETKGHIRHTRGNVLHLWHGEHKHRGYVDRNRELAQLGFDPEQDLTLDENGLWRFTEARQDLKTWASEYFSLRLEDGEEQK